MRVHHKQRSFSLRSKARAPWTPSTRWETPALQHASRGLCEAGRADPRFLLCRCSAFPAWRVFEVHPLVAASPLLPVHPASSPHSSGNRTSVLLCWSRNTDSRSTSLCDSGDHAGEWPWALRGSLRRVPEDTRRTHGDRSHPGRPGVPRPQACSFSNTFFFFFFITRKTQAWPRTAKGVRDFSAGRDVVKVFHCPHQMTPKTQNSALNWPTERSPEFREIKTYLDSGWS